MKPALPRIQTDVPRTLHAQLQVVEAIRTLLGPDEDGRLRQRRAEIAALRRDLEALARDIPIAFAEAAALVKAELRAALRKYSPDQPRVPKGDPHGGEWTTQDGNSNLSPAASDTANRAAPPKRYATLDTGTLSDETPYARPNLPASDDPAKSETQLAADDSSRRKPIDLRDEEAPVGRGHAISEHVGKSDLELLAQMVRKTSRSLFVSLIDRREGSFYSIDTANDLVNATLDAPENAVRIAAVVHGIEKVDLITHDFGFVTGHEMYLPDPDSQPYPRLTDGVGVVIVYDPTKPRGYSIITAYPRTGPVQQ